VLVLDVGDRDANGGEVVAPLPQLSEEFPDVAPLWALHVHEGLVEVHLHEVCLCRESAAEGLPLLLGGRVLLDVHDDFVGETLAHEVACDVVLAVPALDGLVFRVHGVFWVLRNGAWVRTVKVAPVAIDRHCSLEPPDKYSPVAAFRVEVQDFSQ